MSSFLPEVLRTIYAEDSATHLGLICETSDELQCWTQLPVESVILQHSLADRAWIGRLKSAARKVLVWTVNNPTDMLRFRECEVDGIISDDTMALCKTLAR